jgi:hypothetical protein
MTRSTQVEHQITHIKFRVVFYFELFPIKNDLSAGIVRRLYTHERSGENLREPINFKRQGRFIRTQIPAKV